MGARSSSEIQQDDSLNFEVQSTGSELSVNSSVNTDFVEQMLPSLPPPAALSATTIGLHSQPRQLNDASSQVEALQYLSSAYPETVDLVLATADGATEPVHAFYLAIKAPKFWTQQILPQINRFQQQQQHGQQQVHRLITSEQLIYEVPRVLLKELSGQMLHIIVGSMYHRSGCLKLNYGLAWQLLPIGRDYELKFLLKKCFKYLAGQLRHGNAVQVMQMALHFGTRPLASKAYRFILQCFNHILRSQPESLLQLTLSQLTAILSDDHLNIANEMDAFYAAVLWVMHSPATRLAHFWSPLFLHVRTQVMPSTEWPLMAHLFCILARQHESAKVLLLKAKTALSGVHWPMPLFNPRVPYAVALIYGGFENGLPSATLKTFDVRAGRCFSLSLPDAPARVHHATVALQGQGLLLLGGTDGLEALNTAILLNLSTGHFSDCPPMTERRSHLAAVVTGKGAGKQTVIVMGGCNSTNGSLRSCEAYDCKAKVWRLLPPMHTARKEAAAAVHNQKVYITGGVDSFCSSSVEVLTMTPAANGQGVNYAWTVISFMCMPRRGHSLLSCGSGLYAIGGSTDISEFTCLRSVEKLTASGNQWEFVAPMRVVRHAAATVSLEGKLFVFGGYDGASCSKSIESYNAAVAQSGAAAAAQLPVQWEPVTGCQLPTENSSASAAILCDLPTALHLTYYGQCLLQGSRYKPTKARKEYSQKAVARKLIAACKEEMKKEEEEEASQQE